LFEACLPLTWVSFFDYHNCESLLGRFWQEKAIALDGARENTTIKHDLGQSIKK